MKSLKDEKKHNPIVVVICFLALLGAVVSLSSLSNLVWGGKGEEGTARKIIKVRDGMTIAQFGDENKLPPKLLIESQG